jgi:hypothetical protein
LKDFRPVPQGDGQILSLQAQAGQYFQNYSTPLLNLGYLVQNLQHYQLALTIPELNIQTNMVLLRS